MSEMLGNHYFQLKDFVLAERTYEKLSPDQLNDLKILKKLVICHTQTDKLTKALQLLLSIIQRDIGVIINANRNDEDCPCYDLICRIELGEIKYERKKDTFTALGILWLYCNHKTSIKYLKMAKQESINNELLNQILNRLSKLTNQLSSKQIKEWSQYAKECNT